MAEEGSGLGQAELSSLALSCLVVGVWGSHITSLDLSLHIYIRRGWTDGFRVPSNPHNLHPAVSKFLPSLFI